MRSALDEPQNQLSARHSSISIEPTVPNFLDKQSNFSPSHLDNKTEILIHKVMAM